MDCGGTPMSVPHATTGASHVLAQQPTALHAPPTPIEFSALAHATA
jgi:hypothetical protein